MKKAGNILFWTVMTVLIMFIAYTLYNRYKPDVDLQKVPPQTSEDKWEYKAGTGDDTGEKEGEQSQGKALAPDFELEDLNGNKVKLSDYRGKIVFLNFWTTWCPYCVEEMPDLNAANEEFAKANEAVVLAVDIQEPLDTVKKYIADKKLTLPILMDYDGSIANTYRVSGIPTTYVINKDGTIYGYKTGPMTKTQVMNLADKIKQGKEE